MRTMKGYVLEINLILILDLICGIMKGVDFFIFTTLQPTSLHAKYSGFVTFQTFRVGHMLRVLLFSLSPLPDGYHQSLFMFLGAHHIHGG